MILPRKGSNCGFTGVQTLAGKVAEKLKTGTKKRVSGGAIPLKALIYWGFSCIKDSVYIDEGITGTQAKKRPAFMQMIEDAKQGRFDLIVTREVSRFARNTVDALTYVRLLKFDYNVEVFFVEDNIWTMAGDGELRLSLMATLSQDESRKISMRVKAGLEISRKKGAVWGNGNVLGYRKVGDHLEIDEEQAETVRMIYDLYASGQGIKRIAGELELQKRRCSDGQLGVWHPNTIRRILKNPIYCGILTYGKSRSNNYLEKKRIENPEEEYIYVESDKVTPIITKQQFEEVGQLLEKRSAESPIACYQKNKEFYKKDLWAKKMMCQCGSSIETRNVYNKQKKFYGYICCRRKRFGSKDARKEKGLSTEVGCNAPPLIRWKLQMIIRKILSRLWTSRQEAVFSAIGIIQTNINLINVKKVNQNAEVRRIKDGINKAIDLRIAGEITKEELEDYRRNAEQQINKISRLVMQKEKTEKSLKKVQNFMEESLDFSKPIVPDAIIERIVHLVVLNIDGSFDWYLDWGYEIPSVELSSLPEHRKLVDQFTIGYDEAAEYAALVGESVRRYQYKDLDVRVYMIV